MGWRGDKCLGERKLRLSVDQYESEWYVGMRISLAHHDSQWIRLYL